MGGYIFYLFTLSSISINIIKMYYYPRYVRDLEVESAIRRSRIEAEIVESNLRRSRIEADLVNEEALRRSRR